MTRILATASAALLVLLARPAAQPSLRVFFGNLHSHTSYSDGSGTPDDAYRHARRTAHLDFLAITEHNHASAEQGATPDRKDGILIAKNPALYNGTDENALIPTAARWTVNGEFVALYGQEFSSIGKGNHVNVFEVPNVIDVANGEFGKLANEWIPAHLDSSGQPAVLQFNHPALHNEPDEYGADNFTTPAEWLEKIGALAALPSSHHEETKTRSG